MAFTSCQFIDVANPTSPLFTFQQGYPGNRVAALRTSCYIWALLCKPLFQIQSQHNTVFLSWCSLLGVCWLKAQDPLVDQTAAALSKIRWQCLSATSGNITHLSHLHLSRYLLFLLCSRNFWGFWGCKIQMKWNQRKVTVVALTSLFI